MCRRQAPSRAPATASVWWMWPVTRQRLFRDLWDAHRHCVQLTSEHRSSKLHYQEVCKVVIFDCQVNKFGSMGPCQRQGRGTPKGPVTGKVTSQPTVAPTMNHIIVCRAVEEDTAAMAPTVVIGTRRRMALCRQVLCDMQASTRLARALDRKCTPACHITRA